MRLLTTMVAFAAVGSAFLLTSRPLKAFCMVPPIRLDDEFFVSEIVFTGSIIRDQKIGLTSEGFFDARIFTWRVDRVLRGPIVPGQEVQTYTGNDSGRFPLDAGSPESLVGKSFLIFAFRDNQAGPGLYAVDSCGKSIALSKAGAEIREIEALPSHHGGLLYGAMMDGDTDVLITAHGEKGTFSTITHANGSFMLKVPPGRYRVTAAKQGHVYADTDIAYKRSENVVVPDGGSAGLSFREQGR